MNDDTNLGENNISDSQSTLQEEIEEILRPVDREVVRDFLTDIVSQAKAALDGIASPGYLQISRLHPMDERLVLSRFDLNDIELMISEAVAAASAGHNVYIEGRTMPGTLRGGERGKLSDTVAVFALVIDSDADKGMGWVPLDTIQPSMIVESSPGNFHYWFFLDKAVDAQTGQQLGERIRKCAGCDHDTGNVVQPYRVAGTANYPNKKKIDRGRVTVPTYLKEFNVETVWTKEGIEEAFPLPTGGGAANGGGANAGSAQPDEADVPADTMRVIREGSSASASNRDRSQTFWNVMLVLKRLGFTVDGIINLLELYPGGIMQKYEGRLRQEVERAYNKIKIDAESAADEEPRPLRRELPPAIPFPIPAFDCVPVLRDAVIAIQMRTQAPWAIAGNSVLAAATVCAQPHADVLMPYGELRPLSEYFVTVAASGERKTSVDDHAVRAICNREKALRKDFAGAMKDYLEELATWTMQKSYLNKKHKGNRQELRKQMAELGPEPLKPLKPIILLDNPTVEGLEIFAVEGRSSFGLFTGEGGKLIGGHLFNDDNRLKAGSSLNLMWDGKPMPRFRRDYGDKLPGKRFSVHVMVQSGIAVRMLSDQTLSDVGMLGRFLVVAPDSTAGTRFWRDPPESVEKNLAAYDKVLTALLETDPPKGDESNELKPRSLPLSKGASEVWKGFHDEVERKIASDAAWATIRALGAKLPEHAARIAGVLTVVAKASQIATNEPSDDDWSDEPPLDLGNMEIGIDTLKSGIMLANHYAAEALRLVDAGLADPDLVLAEKLLAWLQADPGRENIHLREIYQFGPGGIRDKETAVRIVTILADHGWLVRLPTGTIVDGSQRRDAWKVVR